MSVAMSVAPSASSLSCSCLQAVRNGAVWAGVRRPALGRLCMHATRAPHRPEPAVAAGSRGEPQLPVTSPQCPCDPAFPCSSHTAPPRLQGASRGTAESQARHTHTYTHAHFSAGCGCRSCSACVKPAKRFERSSSFVAAASPSALSETWGEGAGGVRGCREMQGRCTR